MTVTSRPQRPGEVHGKEYFFVSREKMEEDIGSGKFLEFGEYKGNLYGTASENVRSILTAGLTCVLNPHSQALKMLRTAEFKPYIIYVKPPPFEVLKLSRHKAFAKSTFDESNSRAFNVCPFTFPFIISFQTIIIFQKFHRNHLQNIYFNIN